MHIGLIGGIGVAATVVYYQRLTRIMSDRGLPLALTIAHADVQTLLRNNLADNRAEQAEVYARHIDDLKRGGCDCVAITSLGGHFCFEETVALSSLPLVSAVSPLDAFFVSQGYGKIGLLGTRVVMNTRLYGQLRDTDAVVLEGETDTLGTAYQTMAVAGRATDADRALFLDAGQRLMDDAGAEAVVLAGTDLNLIFDGATVSYPVIDALDVHVDVLADLASGQRALSTV